MRGISEVVVASGTPRISVVVPVLNERETILQFMERLLAVLDAHGSSFEVLLVDDGSTDDTFDRVKTTYAGDSRICVLHLTKNFGQQQAVMAGFRECRGEAVITIDADLQNPPEEIPKLLEKLEQGYDVVCGWRKQRHDPLLRRLSSLLLNRIVSRLTRVNLHDYGCMLRAYRREIIERVKMCPEHSTYVTALVVWVGGRFAEVEVAHAAREQGKSKYNYLKLFELYFNLLTGFSILPLQLISFLGMACSVFGFGLGMWLFLVRIIGGNDPSGVRSVFAVLFFLFGLVIFSLGLIGEYIGRIYIEVQGRPGYLVRDKLRLDGIAANGERRMANGEWRALEKGTQEDLSEVQPQSPRRDDESRVPLRSWTGAGAPGAVHTVSGLVPSRSASVDAR